MPLYSTRHWPPAVDGRSSAATRSAGMTDNQAIESKVLTQAAESPDDSSALDLADCATVERAALVADRRGQAILQVGPLAPVVPADRGISRRRAEVPIAFRDPGVLDGKRSPFADVGAPRARRAAMRPMARSCPPAPSRRSSGPASDPSRALPGSRPARCRAAAAHPLHGDCCRDRVGAGSGNRRSIHLRFVRRPGGRFDSGLTSDAKSEGC